MSEQRFWQRITPWLVPKKGRWKWALLRLAIALPLVFFFRFHLLSYLVAVHNYATSSARRNNRADMDYLLTLRGPGARMLARLGEGFFLEQARDYHMLPALLEISRTHDDATARAGALRGAANFRDDTVLARSLEALSDPDAKVRLAACDGLSGHAETRHLPQLTRTLSSESNLTVKTALAQIIESLSAPAANAQGTLVKIAAIQFCSTFGEPAANRARLALLIRRAAGEGAKIVVLPETAISGYMSEDLNETWQVSGLNVTPGLAGRDPQGAAETVPGPSSTEFGNLAQETGIYLTIPILEVDRSAGTPRYFNTVLLAGPDGQILLHYRKLNPWPFAERGWATAGDRGHQIVDTPYGRLALLICYDINFEPAALRLKNVDTLLYPIGWVDVEKSAWFYMRLPRIARLNDLNIIGANWCASREQDWHGHGQSLIITRTGHVLQRATSRLGDEIIFAELPVSKK